MEIKNNEFIGIKFDEQALESINLIATALIHNASALSKMASIFAAQNIQIEAMLKVEGLNASVNDISLLKEDELIDRKCQEEYLSETKE